MKTLNIENHYTSTRKAARLTAKFLKRQGIKATTKSTKQTQGWLVNVKGVSVSKPVKSACKSLSGRLIPVLTK